MTKRLNDEPRLEPVEKADMWKLLAWRNLSRNRKQMLSKHIISREEHSSWWDNVNKNKNIYLFKCIFFEKVMSVIILKELEKQQYHYAFYLTNDGILDAWTSMIFTEKKAISKAKSLGAKILKCDVLVDNRSVIILHQRFGFRVAHEQNLLEVINLELQI
jgi:RimJ/RimL family protein N-acetyltransferase